MSLSHLSDEELWYEIARAKWSVEYDAKQVKETQELSGAITFSPICWLQAGE